MRNLSHFLILLLSLLLTPFVCRAQTTAPASSQTKAPVSADDYLKRGEARVERGNRKGAIADFTKTLELKPSMASAYRNRGFQRLNGADYDQAIADFTKAIELNPQDEIAYLNRGVAQQEKGDLDKAIADFSAAIRLDDRDIFPYLSRSDALVQQGKFQSAVYDLNTAIEIDPEDAKAYGTRGLIWLALGEDDQAERDFTRCFALDSTLEVEFKKSANEVRRNLESDRKAAKERKAAVELAQKEPGSFDAQVKAGTLNYQAERYDEAIEFFTRANKVRPDSYDVIVSLGSANYDANHFETAETWYTAALTKKPEDVNVRSDLGSTFLMRQPPNLDRAIKEYRRCLELDPTHRQALRNLVVALVEKGDAKEAQATLSKLEKLDPNDEALAMLKDKIAGLAKP